LGAVNRKGGNIDVGEIVVDNPEEEARVGKRKIG
jgi:hypothetical protein